MDSQTIDTRNKKYHCNACTDLCYLVTGLTTTAPVFCPKSPRIRPNWSEE